MEDETKILYSFMTNLYKTIFEGDISKFFSKKKIREEVNNYLFRLDDLIVQLTGSLKSENFRKDLYLKIETDIKEYMNNNKKQNKSFEDIEQNILPNITESTKEYFFDNILNGRINAYNIIDTTDWKYNWKGFVDSLNETELKAIPIFLTYDITYGESKSKAEFKKYKDEACDKFNISKNQFKKAEMSLFVKTHSHLKNNSHKTRKR